MLPGKWDHNKQKLFALVSRLGDGFFIASLLSKYKIQLIRGAASLQFGPQFGGLINYKLNQFVNKRKVNKKVLKMILFQFLELIKMVLLIFHYQFFFLV